MAKKDNIFWESATLNNATYQQYYHRLVELAISMFEWKNLPEGVDERFLELTLFSQGMAVFFYDDVMGDYLALQCIIGGQLNVYRIPIQRRAYAVNGYNRELDDKNSVIIFNNLLHTPSRLDVEMFSKRLYNLDRAIDVNANAQKTPILIQCDDSQRLTMKNLYKQYEGNEPFIFGTKALDTKGLQVLQTGAPYVADRLYSLKEQYWNEALTYLGIYNVDTNKKERLIVSEVSKQNGGAVASRYSRLNARKNACKEINKMFGLNIDVDFRDEFAVMDIEKDERINNMNEGGEDE